MFNLDDNSILGLDTGRRLGSFPRFSAEAISDHWTDKVVNSAACCDGKQHFPNSAELRDRGVNVELLAACITAKLVVVEFFAETVETLSTDDLNGALENLIERNADHRDAYRKHPKDGLARAAHLNGHCCTCHAA